MWLVRLHAHGIHGGGQRDGETAVLQPLRPYVAIGAGSHIGALFDHIDLDSHLNLLPDPAMGLTIENGVVTPSDAPGLGVRLIADADA